ncbi:molecular chaperone TorD [Magnetospira thiophila]
MDERALIYRWLSGLFAREVAVEALNTYRTPEGLAFLSSLAAHPTLNGITETLRSLVEGMDDLQSCSLDLASAYARLFLGVGGHRAAPPYESAYVSPRGTLFQEPTKAMADLLRELELSLSDDLKEPPDHIAVQLNVVAELAERMNAAERSGDRVTMDVWREKQIDMLDAHLLSWLRPFSEDCRRHDPSPFYATVATATVSFLEQDRRWLSDG